MTQVLNCPLALLLLSEAICLFLFSKNETLLKILGLSLGFYSEKVSNERNF